MHGHAPLTDATGHVAARGHTDGMAHESAPAPARAIQPWRERLPGASDAAIAAAMATRGEPWMLRHLPALRAQAAFLAALDEARRAS